MRKSTVALIVLCALIMAACGTRLPDEAFVESGELVPADGSSTDGDSASTDGGEVAAGETTTTVAGGSDGTTGGSGGTTGGYTGGSTGGTGGADGPNQASDVGVTESTITIGTIVAENGVLGDAFAPAARGMRAWAAHVNASGGIHGRQVVLKTCDDGESRNRALECARRLVEQEKVNSLMITGDGDLVEVRSGLAANQRIVGSGAAFLQDGDLVRPLAPATAAAPVPAAPAAPEGADNIRGRQG